MADRASRVGVLDNICAEETGVRLRVVALDDGKVRVEIAAGGGQRTVAAATLTVDRVRRLTASLVLHAPRRWQPQAQEETPDACRCLS